MERRRNDPFWKNDCTKMDTPGVPKMDPLGFFVLEKGYLCAPEIDPYQLECSTIFKRCSTKWAVEAKGPLRRALGRSWINFEDCGSMYCTCEQ